MNRGKGKMSERFSERAAKRRKDVYKQQAKKNDEKRNTKLLRERRDWT